MAQAKLNNKGDESTISLILSLSEAAAMMTLVGHISGENVGNSHIHPLYYALERVGFRSHDSCLNQVSIKFTQGSRDIFNREVNRFKQNNIPTLPIPPTSTPTRNTEWSENLSEEETIFLRERNLIDSENRVII